MQLRRADNVNVIRRGGLRRHLAGWAKSSDAAGGAWASQTSLRSLRKLDCVAPTIPDQERAASGTSSATVTVTSTRSPIRTGARKLSVCEM